MLVIPSYLRGRVDKGEALPEVEVAVAGPGGGGGERGVVWYVMCGDLKEELFIELMELMGRAGGAGGGR